MIATGYGSGYTLRFPRCRFIFWDRASRDHPASEDHRDRDMWNCVRAVFLSGFAEQLADNLSSALTSS
jgi:hypothetical protein